MISYYKLSDNSIETWTDEASADWLDIAAPSEEELAVLGRNYSLLPSFLHDPLDEKERPHLDSEGEALMIVVRLSVPGTEKNMAFETVPVGLILVAGKLLTVCARPNLVRQTLDKAWQRKRKWSPVLLVFALFLAASAAFMKNMQIMEERAEQAETRLFNSIQNSELISLLSIEKALIANTVALKSNHNLMVKFLKPETFELNYSKIERDLLDDALTESQQAIFTAEIFSQILGSMGDAFGSIISNNLNKVMKFLTAITIILMVPTVIAGLYGMNVNLPWAEKSWAFAFVCGLTIFSCLITTIFFIYRKWF